MTPLISIEKKDHPMSIPNLDRSRIRDLFDLRNRERGDRYGDYRGDPYPEFQRLRETGPVHAGTMHELIGYQGDPIFFGVPEHGRPHFTVFSYDECYAIYRNPEVFASSPPDVPRSTSGVFASMLSMNGAEHRRYRALVQASFVPAKGKWWLDNWIQEIIDGLIDSFAADGRADLNVDFDAPIPMLTITGSFGLSVEEALDVRAALEGVAGGRSLVEILQPIVAARHEDPQDDLLSVLCHAEVKDEDGATNRLSDTEILTFANLLLQAGSGTTWKQMGITLVALLTTPGALDAVRNDRALLRFAVEEGLRWNVTDPAFGRWVTEDTTIAGVRIPRGAVVQPCIGAANRDPARWQHPDNFDIHREFQSSLAFANGPHICLGQHVARAEMVNAIGALLDRLPNLRLDPDAEPPSIIGLYERGPTHIPVVWDL